MMKALWCLPVLLTVVGCNSRDATNITDDAQKFAHDAGRSMSGVSLAAKVNMVLAVRKGVDISGLHVEAKDGVVTISGHVQDDKQKGVVIATADEITGVDKVVDDLKIESQSVKPDAK